MQVAPYQPPINPNNQAKMPGSGMNQQYNPMAPQPMQHNTYQPTGMQMGAPVNPPPAGRRNQINPVPQIPMGTPARPQPMAQPMGMQMGGQPMQQPMGMGGGMGGMGGMNNGYNNPRSLWEATLWQTPSNSRWG